MILPVFASMSLFPKTKPRRKVAANVYKILLSVEKEGAVQCYYAQNVSTSGGSHQCQCVANTARIYLNLIYIM